MATLQLMAGLLTIAAGVYLVVASLPKKVEQSFSAAVSGPSKTIAHEVRLVGFAQKQKPDFIAEDAKLSSMKEGDHRSVVAPYRVEGEDFIVHATTEWWELFRELHGHHKYALALRYRVPMEGGGAMSAAEVIIHTPTTAQESP